jgi:hypothetical protein
MFRTVIKPQVIENDTGQYKVWSEKVFCDSYYMFFANQISVKVNGQHYLIEPKLETFRFYEMNTQKSVFEPIAETYEIRLKRLRGAYTGRITELKRRFEYFKRDVERKITTNEIKKVN